MSSPPDFITQFMQYTAWQVSPEIFKRWTAISMVGAAVERRVWARTQQGPIWPNLFTILVAPPGVGKFVIETARELATDACEPGSKIPAFKIASDSVTNASLMDELAASKTVRLGPSGPPEQFASLYVVAEELEVLLPAYDKQFISSLNTLYNNKRLHRETRRTGMVRKLEIENPQLSILAGAQPAYFAGTFPEDAWNTGLGRRMLMVYSNETILHPLWGVERSLADAETEAKALLGRLSGFWALWGQARWSEAAAKRIGDWHLGGRAPEPKHSKLIHYNRGRTVNVIKLALISMISRGEELLIEDIDIKRAFEWLFEAEALMPDIFREMIGKSDAMILEEMHLAMMQMWGHGKGKSAIKGDLIRRFLLQRVPHEKVETLLSAAEKAGLVARVKGSIDDWVPRPRAEYEAE